MSSLLEKLKSVARQTKDITWPSDPETTVQIRTLTDADYTAAGIAADAVYKDVTIGMENISKYDGEFETQLLFRAVCDPETGKQLTNNISAFKELISPECKDLLAEELEALHDEFIPDPGKLDDEEFTKLVETVKKNARDTVGNISSLSTLRRLIITLASQPSS